MTRVEVKLPPAQAKFSYRQLWRVSCRACGDYRDAADKALLKHWARSHQDKCHAATAPAPVSESPEVR